MITVGIAETVRKALKGHAYAVLRAAQEIGWVFGTISATG
jgi:hypothetical protein